MPKTIDLTGQRFGRLVVLEHAGRDAHRNALWRCKCDCGGEKTTQGGSLRKGLAQSCGCIVSERMAALNTQRLRTHGMSKTRIYGQWANMIRRCHDPKDADYPNYGARGIVVCDRWRESFENFYADMGVRPTGMSLDRRDNNGPYSPENCRWADLRTQHNNTRANRVLAVNGRSLTVTEWCRELGLRTDLVFARLRRGWSAQDALRRDHARTGPIPRRFTEGNP